MGYVVIGFGGGGYIVIRLGEGGRYPTCTYQNLPVDTTPV